MKYVIFILLTINSIAAAQTGRGFRRLDSTITPPIDTLDDPGADIPRSHLLIDVNFETFPDPSVDLYQGLAGWKNGTTTGGCCSYSKLKDSTFVNHGTYSCRYRVDSSDADVAGSKRTEHNCPSYFEPVVNVKRWYGIAHYLPVGYENDPNGPESIVQGHQYSGTGSPPWAIWVQGNHYKFVRNTEAGQTILDLGAITTGAYVNWVLEIQYDDDGTHGGYMKLYKNNVLTAVNGTGVYTGKNTYAGQTKGVYMKCGIYKWGWKKHPEQSIVASRVVYIDDIRIGNEFASYNDVAPVQILP